MARETVVTTGGLRTLEAVELIRQHGLEIAKQRCEHPVDFEAISRARAVGVWNPKLPRLPGCEAHNQKEAYRGDRCETAQILDWIVRKHEGSRGLHLEGWVLSVHKNWNPRRSEPADVIVPWPTREM